MARQNNTLSIIGLVIGIISLLISFIPCIGSLGALPAIIGLILGFLGYRESKNSDISTTPAIIALVLSGLALLIGAGQAIFLSSAGKNVYDASKVEYADCDELLLDWETTVNKLADLSSIPEDEQGFSTIKDVIKVSTKVATIRIKSEDMGCTADSTFNAKFEELEDKIEKFEN